MFINWPWMNLSWKLEDSLQVQNREVLEPPSAKGEVAEMS